MDGGLAELRSYRGAETDGQSANPWPSPIGLLPFTPIYPHKTPTTPMVVFAISTNADGLDIMTARVELGRTQFFQSPAGLEFGLTLLARRGCAWP